MGSYSCELKISLVRTWYWYPLRIPKIILETFLSGGITHEKIDSSIFSGLVEAADKTNSWFITSGIHNVSA